MTELRDPEPPPRMAHFQGWPVALPPTTGTSFEMTQPAEPDLKPEPPPVENDVTEDPA